ncbi:MAG: hypothetical protein IPK04_01420 [Bdellovibrionales bacterium]|nr:hypothetical protein [Bdellovibrionales bacterium]
MIKILALSLTILLVTACKSGDGDDAGPVRSPVTPAPATPAPAAPDPEPAPVPPAPVEPDKPPIVGLLTEQEIIAIRSELQLLMRTKHFELYEEAEKRQLAGALLFIASMKIKPLDWEVLTDKEVEDLLSLYFNENLTLK